MNRKKDKKEEMKSKDPLEQDQKKKDDQDLNNIDFEYDIEEFKKNLKVYSKIIDKSDDIVAAIYRFMNKTLDQPSKGEIDLYRKSINMAIKKGNQKKYGLLYKIIAKNIYDYKEFIREENIKADNNIIINPNIFAISWNDLQANIKDRLRNTDSEMLSPQSLEFAYKEELNKIKNLYNKLKDMHNNGVEIPNDVMNITRTTMLKLTELVNVFMLENFDELQPMMQEIQMFEKHHNFTTDAKNSIFIDANFKTITNLAAPVRETDAVTKKYVDEQIEKVRLELNVKK